jgi:hypothetical protein
MLIARRSLLASVLTLYLKQNVLFELKFIRVEMLMKHTSRFAIAFLTFTAGFLALAGWSAHIGRKVWSPRVFAWRNPFKPPPIIEEQANCPVHLIDARFYSFMSIGSSIGSVLQLDVKNVSNKPIHSFTISYRSAEPTDTGSGGWQPQTLLQPGQSHAIGISSNGDKQVTFAVNFVQFADGDVWYADPPRATVKPEGVRTGAQAATEYLRQILESDGASAVMNALADIRLRVESPEFSTNEAFGHFGFYDGVTNTVVRVEYAYQKSGLSGVEEFLARRGQ